MVTGWTAGGRPPTPRALLPAAFAVLPLLATDVWDGFRLALTDTALAAITPNEQPLSIRSLGGVWAVGLALGWFGLAYRRREWSIWEIGLVLVGGAAALARVGNVWLDAFAMLLPLARQLGLGLPKPRIQLGLAVLSVGVAAAVIVGGKPPSLPRAALDAAAASGSSKAVFTDWRWTGDLQRQLGGLRPVLPAGGLTDESTDFWLDYLRVDQGHERWGALLDGWNVDLVVLEAANQQRQVAALIRTSPEWRVVYDAEGALVAQRSGS